MIPSTPKTSNPRATPRSATWTPRSSNGVARVAPPSQAKKGNGRGNGRPGSSTSRVEKVKGADKQTKEHSDHAKLAFRRIMQNVRQKAMNAKNKDGSDSILGLRQVFSSFDIDGSGFLDELEFQTVRIPIVSI